MSFPVLSGSHCNIMSSGLSQGDWKSQIAEVLPKDQVPQHWGGHMTDPDGNPQCRLKVTMATPDQ